ncbi:MAG: hypothetical protein C0601_01325 [Candidatus Muiribacterium halophilum]|uniref:Peptidase M48 domain-containing protein n=1 Tax=Muiribacterium halophilum TaxID=2053465 RepID=A0A2N5ZLI7_MUIH1|nr:MAG: hypothetical protein C0601_01325 [Candidatus Muirbacterium halophilum]
MNIKKVFICLILIVLIYVPSFPKNVVKEVLKGTERNLEIILGEVSSLSVRATTRILPVNHPDHIRMRRISKRLVENVNRKNIRYYFKVLDLDYPNAFALPGGRIYITKKLIDMSDDEELACVIGHEIGHIEKKHSIRAFERQLITAKILDYYSKKSKTVKDNEKLIAIANAIFNELRYSRENEREADKYSVDITVKSGYNPYGMIRFFNKLLKLNKGHEDDSLKMLRTHPLTKERIQYTSEYIRKKLH